MKVNVTLIFEIAIIILLVLILRGCGREKLPDNSKENALYERLIKTIEQERDDMKREKDSTIAEGWRKDSIYKNQQKVYVNHIKEIPVYVDRLDKSGLHSEISNLPGQ